MSGVNGTGDAATRTAFEELEARLLLSHTHGSWTGGPPPGGPTVTVALAAASDTGLSNSDEITKLTTLTFQGTTNAANGSTVALVQNSPTVAVLGTALVAAGAWTVPDVAGFTEGTYQLYAMVNGGVSSALELLVDTTAPVVTAQRDTPANANGWNNTNVAASYTAADTGGSGIDAVNSDAPTFTFTAEGAGQSHTFTAVDVAGNTGTGTVTGVDIDKTPPVVTAQRDTPANAQGWNNTAVLSSYTATDAGGSGIDAAASDTTPFTFTAEGAAQSHTFTAYDLAGNAGTDTVDSVNIDKTPPVVTVTTAPAGNPFYALNAVVPASYTTTDALSLILTSGGTVANGANISTTPVGAKPFQVTATDNAGNTTTVDHPYEVISPTAELYLRLSKKRVFDIQVNVLDGDGRRLPADGLFATGTVTDVQGRKRVFHQTVPLTTPGDAPLIPADYVSAEVNVRMQQGRKRKGKAALRYDSPDRNSLAQLGLDYFLHQKFSLSPQPSTASDDVNGAGVPVVPSGFVHLGTWAGPFVAG